MCSADPSLPVSQVKVSDRRVTTVALIFEWVRMAKRSCFRPNTLRPSAYAARSVTASQSSFPMFFGSTVLTFLIEKNRLHQTLRFVREC